VKLPVFFRSFGRRGPVAVNITLDHPHRVSRLVLINTYCDTAPRLRLPEMIRLFADQNFAPLADAMTENPRPAPMAA
jgi:pimeloyl-ACP methyl ester carboxylesterase